MDREACLRNVVITLDKSRYACHSSKGVEKADIKTYQKETAPKGKKNESSVFVCSDYAQINRIPPSFLILLTDTLEKEEKGENPFPNFHSASCQTVWNWWELFEKSLMEDLRVKDQSSSHQRSKVKGYIWNFLGAENNYRLIQKWLLETWVWSFWAFKSLSRFLSLLVFVVSNVRVVMMFFGKEGRKKVLLLFIEAYFLETLPFSVFPRGTGSSASMRNWFHFS